MSSNLKLQCSPFEHQLPCRCYSILVLGLRCRQKISLPNYLKLEKKSAGGRFKLNYQHCNDALANFSHDRDQPFSYTRPSPSSCPHFRELHAASLWFSTASHSLLGWCTWLSWISLSVRKIAQTPQQFNLYPISSNHRIYWYLAYVPSQNFAGFQLLFIHTWSKFASSSTSRHFVILPRINLPVLRLRLNYVFLTFVLIPVSLGLSFVLNHFQQINLDSLSGACPTWVPWPRSS